MVERLQIATRLVRIIIVATILAALGAQHARAATFPIIAPGVIAVEGEIELGDCERWQQALVPGLTTVLLNSPGGRVGQGECISRSIAKMRLMTTVVQRCASICFLMFAAGTERHVCEGARIGIHRPSIAGTREDNPDPAALNGILDHATQFGVPELIRVRLSETPNKDVYWLTDDDLRLMNAQDCR